MLRRLAGSLHGSTFRSPEAFAGGSSGRRKLGEAASSVGGEEARRRGCLPAARRETLVAPDYSLWEAV
jgi:hypothetical protein